MLPFDKRIMMLYGISVAAIALVAILITVIAVAVTKPKAHEPVSSEIEVPAEQYRPDFNEIMIPDDLIGEKSPSWYPLREPVQRWTKEMAEPYWIPVEEIIAEYIEKQNDEKIEQIITSIP